MLTDGRAGGVRARLIDALCEVAELEHSLCLQYLYAAFSLKTRPDEGGLDEVQAELVREWKGQLLLLAREEMLHLGLVLNLLASVGGVAYLRRPNFPQPERYYPLGTIAALEPFSAKSLERFLSYELPSALLPAQQPADGPGVETRMTVGQLYERIRHVIMTVEEKDLFIGSALRQVDTAAVIDPEGVFDEDVAVGYGVEPFAIYDRSSALRAVDLIVEQGEGATESEDDSHYNRLMRIKVQLTAELEEAARTGRTFKPARPMLDNPVVQPAADAEGANVISEPLAREAAELFDAGYGLLVLMLLRFYNRVDESTAEQKRIQRVAFFPLMTMFTRPLGEILSELPALTRNSSVTAGPPFEFQRGLALIPERNVAHQVFVERLIDLSRRARLFADHLKNAPAPPRLRHRAELMARDVERIYRTFSGGDQTDLAEGTTVREG
ncbi:ferritin-like domain-containing protein [Streptomyces sp. M92]|uniref:ferritin-like domain-containing protein n=1 Tax=Streptomyces sp. M92 TaxID=2944250 RepID=UPI00234A3B10|nr:ferritin-like domain-containing protein [Streptomyces sp. M92]WCN04115.1 ferritin-like protein [Streptomyces sp. M92]